MSDVNPPGALQVQFDYCEECKGLDQLEAVTKERGEFRERVAELEEACRGALWGLHTFGDNDEAFDALDGAEADLVKVLPDERKEAK